MAKRRVPPNDKMRRPEGNKESRAGAQRSQEADRAALTVLTAQVQAALGLVDSETADALIGEQIDEHGALIRAANAITTMNWMAMKANGVRENPATLRMSAQTQMIVLDLVHKSYALGIRMGEATNYTNYTKGEEGG